MFLYDLLYGYKYFMGKYIIYKTYINYIRDFGILYVFLMFFKGRYC